VYQVYYVEADFEVKKEIRALRAKVLVGLYSNNGHMASARGRSK
jgi:hypothetical protein